MSESLSRLALTSFEASLG